MLTQFLVFREHLREDEAVLRGKREHGSEENYFEEQQLAIDERHKRNTTHCFRRTFSATASSIAVLYHARTSPTPLHPRSSQP